MPVRFSIGLVLVLALAPVRGDQPQPETPMVDLNVIAVDSHGQPVTDLTRDEFQVTDAGKPQNIVFFRHNSAKLRQARPTDAHEFSNRRGTNIPHATVILLDLMNQGFATRGISSGQLSRYLDSLESADYLYLYILTIEGRIYPVHGLPNREAVTPQPGQPWTRDSKRLLDDAIREVTRVRPTYMDVALRVQLTYRALEDLAAQLSRVPGRKNMVWITDGVPLTLGPMRSDTGDYVDFTPLLRQLSAALDRSGIAIYPVRQVMMGSPDTVGDGPGGGPAGGRSGLGSIDTLEQFAAMTGGRPDAGKDIGAAIKQALSDMQTSYQVGYYPASKNWDSKYHKLRVTCKRKGVRIQSKTAYYAWPEPPGTRAEQAVNMAATTTFDAAEIGLRATLTADPNQAHAARIDAHVDANDIVLANEGDQYTGQLRFAVVEYTIDNRANVSALNSLDVRLNDQQREQALADGISVTENLTMDDNIRSLRLVVFDRGSDTVGSVSIPLKQASPTVPIFR